MDTKLRFIAKLKSFFWHSNFFNSGKGSALFLLTTFVLIMTAGILFTSASPWTGPAQAPPGGNVDVPINVGSIDQYKLGGLGIGGAAGQSLQWLKNIGGTLSILNASNNPNLVIGQDGSVGIGTTEPGKKLHVFAENYDYSGNRHLAGTKGAVIEGEDTGLQIIGQDTSEWMAHLILSGVPESGDNKHWIMYHSGPMGNNSLKVGYKTSAASDFDASLWGSEVKLAILTNGNVGIGYEDPWEKLVVDGNVWAWDFQYASDITLKKDIVAIPDALQKILSLQGVSFKWADSGILSVGLIAQDVEKIFPELVSIDPKTGLKSVGYGNLVAPLIEAVKEQQKEINQLRAEMEELKKMINK